MEQQLLRRLHARSGDKGDKANIALFAPDRATYDLLVREVTADRVREHFAGIITGQVERFEVPNVLALNFVLHGALNGGASRSLRSDSLGKSLASALLRMLQYPQNGSQSSVEACSGPSAVIALRYWRRES